MNVYYATADTVPVKVNGVHILVLFQGIWFISPDNEQMFVKDCNESGAKAVKAFDCTGFDYQKRATVLNWPEMD